MALEPKIFISSDGIYRFYDNGMYKLQSLCGKTTDGFFDIRDAFGKRTINHASLMPCTFSRPIKKALWYTLPYVIFHNIYSISQVMIKIYEPKILKNNWSFCEFGRKIFFFILNFIFTFRKSWSHLLLIFTVLSIENVFHFKINISMHFSKVNIKWNKILLSVCMLRKYIILQFW